MSTQIFDISERDSRVDIIIKNGFEFFSSKGLKEVVFFNTHPGHKYRGHAIIVTISECGSRVTFRQYRSVECTVDYTEQLRNVEILKWLGKFPEDLDFLPE